MASVSQGDLRSGLSGLADASNVLLLAPAMGGDDEACGALMSVVPPHEADVLSVTITQSPDDRFDVWRAEVGADPAKAGFVSVETTRSAAAAPAATGPGPGMTLDTVSSPGDLTGLGMRITDRISEWAGDGNRIVVCFHSLTALLQYSDLERVFRFLHVLSNRFEAADAVAHYHMDPGAHDEQTVNTVAGVMDAVVERGEDGWTTSVR